MKRTVKLRHLLEFTCPVCREEQPVEFAPLTADELDEHTVRQILELDEWEPIPEGHAVTGFKVPTHVDCRVCGERFKAEEPEGFVEVDDVGDDVGDGE